MVQADKWSSNGLPSHRFIEAVHSASNGLFFPRSVATFEGSIWLNGLNHVLKKTGFRIGFMTSHLTRHNLADITWYNPLISNDPILSVNSSTYAEPLWSPKSSSMRPGPRHAAPDRTESRPPPPRIPRRADHPPVQRWWRGFMGSVGHTLRNNGAVNAFKIHVPTVQPFFFRILRPCTSPMLGSVLCMSAN